MSGKCPSCGCEQAESLLCHDDTSRLERELGDVAALVGELDITLSKQARIGVAGAPGLARERTPINVGAMQAADNLGNVLTTWARDVCPPSWTAGFGGYGTSHCARALLSNVGLIRRHPAVTELVDEITDAIHQARRVIDRPADRIFVGPCMSEQPDNDGRLVTCLEDLYARPNAGTVRCKVCTWEHDVTERRQWLLNKATDRLFTVREAAQMMGDVGGMKITESTIRNYISAGLLAYHGKFRGSSVIRLGDLLNVIGDIAERREMRRSARSA